MSFKVYLIFLIVIESSSAYESGKDTYFCFYSDNKEIINSVRILVKSLLSHRKYFWEVLNFLDSTAQQMFFKVTT